jgi:hypothetical protein
MSSVSHWDNEYARVARASSQLRTQGLSSSTNPQQLQQNLARLDNSLNTLPVSGSELQRRRRLVHNMQQNPAGSPGGFSPPQSQMAMAMRQQDDMIDELAVGVSRLRDQTQVIGDEARMHVNLLGDMETNLDAAHAGLENETRRAAQLKEDQSVWRLQLTVAGLSVFLVLLILMGLS